MFLLRYRSNRSESVANTTSRRSRTLALLASLILIGLVVTGSFISIRSSAANKKRASERSNSSLTRKSDSDEAAANQKPRTQQSGTAALRDLSTASAKHHWAALRRFSMPAASPAAAVLTATKVDALFTDVDGDTKADPGDTLEYTIVVSNTGNADATNTIFTDTLTDTNLMFVPGSVTTTPLARNDTYNGILGNVSIAIPVANGLLVNDSDPDNVGPALTASAGTTTTQGGTIAVSSDGSFTYDPPAGYEGADTFTYTLSDGEGNTDTATATLNVSGMIWFVNNNAGACTTNCDGRLSHPFTSLANFQAVNDGAGNHPADNDNIFLYESNTAYVGPVTLRGGQKLIGQDATASLQTITGLTPPTGSPAPSIPPAFPTMDSGNATIVKITSLVNAVNTSSNNTSNLIRGLTIGNTTGIGISGSSFGTLTVLDVSITDTGTRTGQALGLTSGTLSATIANLVSSAATNGISLTGVNGTLTISAGSLSTLSGADFLVSGGDAGIAFPGPITNTAGRSIDIQGHTGGTISFSGAISDTGTGIFLNNNAGATINFTGGLNLSTGSSPAFTATGAGPAATSGGTVSATQNNTTIVNTITTTTGAALNVAHTTIGGSGLTFRSVSQNGGTNGIVLNNTGTSGGLTVTGNSSGTGATSCGGGVTVNAVGTPATLIAPFAADCTGGTIQNTSGSGISLTNTRNVSLTRMRVKDSGGSGVFGTDLTNFSLISSWMDSNGDTTGFVEAGLRLDNLYGTCAITNSAVKDSFENNLLVSPSVGSASLKLDNLAISGSQFGPSPAGSGNAGIQVRATGTARAIVTINNSSATNNPALGIQGSSNNTALLSMYVTNTTVTDTATAMSFFADLSGDLNYVVQNNTITRIGDGQASSAIALLTNSTSTNASQTQGNITGNAIGDNNVRSGLNAEGAGIGGDFRGTADVILSVTNNTIKHTANNGVFIQKRNPAPDNGGGMIDLSFRDNSITNIDDVTPFPFGFIHGTQLWSRNTGAMCLDIAGNTSSGVGGAQHFETEAKDTATYKLERLTGSGTDDTNVGNFIAGQNDAGSTALAFHNNPGGYTAVANGACRDLNIPPAPSFAGGGGGGGDTQLRPRTSARTSNGKQVAPPAAPDHDVLVAALGRQPGKESNVAALSQSELNAVMYSAKQRLAAAGVTYEDLAILDGATFEIADLEDGVLATGKGRSVKIDETAAGYGWYVDQAAEEDSEFTSRRGASQLGADASSLAYRQMDLVTAVMREMIYVLGREKQWKIDSLQGLTSETLSPGTRRLPDSKPWIVQVPEEGSSSSNRLPDWMDFLGSPEQSSDLNGSEPSAQSASAVALDSNTSSTNHDELTAHARQAEPQTTNRQAEQSAQYVEIASNGYMPTDLGKAMRLKQAAKNTARTGATLPAAPTADVTTNIGTLPQAKSITIKFRAQIKDPLVTPAAQVCNQGAVTADGPLSVMTTDPGPPAVNGATCTPLDVADLQLTKTDSPDPVSAGANITYTLNFKNNGPSAANSVALSDAVPTNTTFVSVVTPVGWTRTDAVAVGGTGTLTWTKNADAANQETAVFTVVVKVGASVASGTTINNSATVTSLKTDPDSSNNTATASTTVQTRADLQMSKSDTPDPVLAGQNITYTVNYQNNGPSDAQSVQLSDPIPTNTTFVSVTTPAGWTRTDSVAAGGTGTITFTKATSAVSDTASFTLVVKVNSSAAHGSTITNNATASSATTDPTPGNDTGQTTTTVNRQADLELTKSDSPDVSVNAGDNITYTLTLTNHGPSNSSTVVVSDATPANTTLVSASTSSPGWSRTDVIAGGGTGTITFAKSDVGNSEVATFTIVVNVNANAPHNSTITNTATRTTATTDPVNTNDSGAASTTVINQADLQVTKTDSPDPVTAGNNLTYTITVTNAGPGAATSASMSDAMPAGTTFVSVNTPSGWTRTDAVAVGGNGTISFTKASVPNGEVAVFTLVVKVSASTANNTTLTNHALVACGNESDNSNNDSGAVQTTVNTSADIQVTKTDSPDPVTAGNNLTYTVTITNNGPSDAQSVSLTDATPTHTTFVSEQQNNGPSFNCTTPTAGSTGTVSCSIATLAAGASAEFQIVVHVEADTPNGTHIMNSATGATTTSDPTPGNNDGTSDTTVNTSADLEVSKSDTPDPVTAGQDITYTINFKNNGPSDAQSVSVSDATPTGTTFVSVTTPAGWTRTDSVAAGGTGTITFTKSTVANQETASWTLVLHVDSNVASGTVISNSATKSSTTSDSNNANDTGQTTTTVNTSADIEVTKSDTPDPVTANSNITYTISVKNNGPSDAQTLGLSDTLPANTTFVSLTVPAGWTRTDAVTVGGTGTITATATTQAANTSADFTLVVKVDANTPHATVITNNATATSATTDPTPGNETGTTTTTVNAQADLSVTKTDLADPVMLGSDVNYHIVVKNNGAGNALGVVLTDKMPQSVTFISATPSAGSCMQAANTITCNLGDMLNGAEVTVDVVIKATTVNTVSDTVSVTSSVADPVSSNNHDTETTRVVGFRQFSFAPPIFTGGCPGNSVGTLLFTSPAPAGIQINFADASAAVDPIAPVTTVGGELSIPVNAATQIVAAQQIVNVTASHGTNSLVGRLKILPIRITSLTFDQNPVVGGNLVTGTVTLTCPAPKDILVRLAFDKAVAKPDVTTFTIPMGQISGTFTIPTKHPLSQTIATITATANGGYLRSTLTVTP